MFNIFINDIFDFVKKGDHHSFLISIVKGYGEGSQRPLINPLRWQRHIGYYLTDSSNLQLF
jgi:hypothetical protein